MIIDVCDRFPKYLDFQYDVLELYTYLLGKKVPLCARCPI